MVSCNLNCSSQVHSLVQFRFTSFTFFSFELELETENLPACTWEICRPQTTVPRGQISAPCRPKSSSHHRKQSVATARPVPIRVSAPSRPRSQHSSCQLTQSNSHHSGLYAKKTRPLRCKDLASNSAHCPTGSA